MTRTDTQAVVSAAVDAGRLPAGGPSEAAAYNLLDQLPADYWRRWSAAADGRIRSHVEHQREAAGTQQPQEVEPT